MRMRPGWLLLVWMLCLTGSSAVSSDASVLLQDRCTSERNADCLNLEGVASTLLIINPPEENPEGAVISVASFWRELDRTGGVRIRAWSRQERIESLGFATSIIRFNFRIRPSPLAGDRREFFDIVFTTPEAKDSRNILGPVVYDIISLFGIPTGTIEVIVNDIIPGPVSVNGVSGSGNEATTEIASGERFATVELPASISANANLDRQLSGQTSGLQVYYEYKLRGAMATADFPIEASARVIYGVSRRGNEGPFLPAETDYVSIMYLNTTELQRVYVPIVLR